jgi:regulator of sirC expression with transglutaminase-like and TPR domain
LLFCCLIGAAGCAGGPEHVKPAPAGRGTGAAPPAAQPLPSLAEAMARPDAAFDPGLAAALLSAQADPSADAAAVLAQFDAMAEAVRRTAPRGPRPREMIRAMRAVISDQAGLRHDGNDPNGYDPDNLLIHRVLARRRGYCVSLSVVWLAVGHRLRLPLRAVRLPGHFLIRWEDDRFRANIECTDHGVEHADAYYAQKYRVHPVAKVKAQYLQSLPPRAVVIEMLNNLGVLAHRRGASREAEGLLTRAVQLAPDHPMVRYNRGVVRAAMGARASAVADFTAAVQADPNHTAAWLNRADLRRRAGDRAGALQDVERARRADPKYGGVSLARALMALESGALELAATELAAAEQANPKDPRVWVAKARLLRKQGQPSAALLAANQALVFDKADAEAHAERAHAYHALKNSRKALASWDAAVRLAPERVDIRHNRAVSRAAAGDLDGAIADLRETVRLQPNWRPGWVTLSKALHNAGDKAGAAEAKRRAAALAGR